MARTRVFVSFDFDNDQALKTLIIGQAQHPNSTFEVTDGSLKEEQSQREWEAKARAAINCADVFLVMLGSKTRSAPGVREEVKMANELGKRRFQIIGYRNGSEDWAVPEGGRTYRWHRDNLRKLLAQ
jgi:hypothetical protein